MRNNILLISIIILGIFIRFYRLPELMSFSYEQALALEASGQMVRTSKISLIGVEYFIRQTSAGHSFFNSAFYLYPSAMIQWLFGFDPLAVTIFFTLLNLLAGIGLYFLVKRYFSPTAAIISLVLFMFSPTMIDFSRSIWHVHLLVPMMVLVIWLLSQSLHFLEPLWFICLGFCLGLGFGFNVSFVLAFALVFLISGYFLFRKHKLGYLAYLLLGFVLGNLPTLLFDLRHSFYNTSTITTYLLEMFTGRKTGFSFQPYHFTYFFVPIFIIISIILSRYLPKVLSVSLLAIYILVSIPGWRLTDKYPKGMPAGTNLQTLRQISAIIAQDAPADFEVASILDGETRAENLRYFLTYVHQKPAMSSDQYPEAKILYVVSYLDQDPLTKSVWELDSLKPAKLSREWKINELIKLTKLEKL